jgi:hypothetical protein
MTNIYEKHDKAFYGISSYVIAQITADNTIERLATINFTRNRNSGNVRCFFHFIGYEMQLGQAGGGGYDKCSAAFLDAVFDHVKVIEALPEGERYSSNYDNDVVLSKLLLACAEEGNGSSHWHNVLRDKGFQLLQTI